MQKSLLVVLLVLGLSPGRTVSQNVLSLDQLIGLANCETYDCFDEKARLYGFSFDKRATTAAGNTRYEYLKEVKAGETMYANFLSYTEYDDGKPNIMFRTSITDLVSLYRRSLSRHNLRSVDCSQESETDETKFCYESEFHHLVIRDLPGNDNGKKYRWYQAAVYKI